jgi:hypothetical protein
MAKIKYEDAFDDASFKAGFAELFNYVKKIKTEAKDIAIGAGASLKGNKYETTDDLKKHKDDLDKVSASTKAYALAEKQLLDIQTKKEAVEKGNNDRLVKEKLLLQEAAAAQKARIKEELSAIGSYDKLAAQYEINKQKLNAMSDSVRKNTEEGKKLETETNAIYTEMKKLQEATGKHTLSVGDYGKAFTTVKQELKEVRTELQLLVSKGETLNNPRVKELSKRFDELSDSISKSKNMANLMDKAGMFQGFVKSLSTVTAAFEVAQGAAGLFGDKNEDLQKAMLKVQSAIAMTHGLEVIANNFRKESTAFLFLQTAGTKALAVAQVAYNAVVGTSTGALKVFRIALASTGIGLAVIGIGLLIANWDKLKLSITGITEKQKLFNELQKKSNENIADQVSNLASLTVSIQNENINSERRNSLIDEYNEIAKTANINTLDYADGVNTLNSKLVKNIELLQAQAIQEASKEKQKDIAKEYLDLLIEQKDLEAKVAKDKTDQSIMMRTAGGVETDNQRALLKVNKELNVAQNEWMTLHEFIILAQKKMKIVTKETKEEKKEENKITEESNEIMKEAVDLAFKPYFKIIEETDEAEKSLIETEKARLKAAGLTTESIKFEADAYKELTTAISEKEEQLRAAIASGSDQTMLDYLAGQIKRLKEELAKYDKTYTDLTKDTKDNEKELLQATVETTEAITKSYIKRSEIKQKSLDDELSAAKEYESQLRELAKKQIEGATDNLAFEQRKQAELEKKKEKERKRQERLELGLAAVTTFGKLAETDAKTALPKTITEIVKLMAFINTLPGFAEGVIDFEGTGTTKSDSNLARISKHESVMKAEATEAYKPQLEAMQKLKYNPLDFIQIPRFTNTSGQNVEKELLMEVKNLNKTIENKPEYQIDINALTHEIVERITKGNNTIINRYKKPFLG